MSWEDDDWENEVAPALPAAGEAAPATFSDEEEAVDLGTSAVASEGSKPKKAVDSSKLKAKKASKQREKELAKQLEEEAEAARNAKPLTKEERNAEKLRLQRLVEEADNDLTNDLFQVKKEEGKLDAESIQALLQNIPLETDDDFKSFATAVGKRVEIEDKPFLAIEFLKELCRSVGRGLKGADLAEVIGVLGVVKNEKIKSQLNKKKKKGGKKFANVARKDFDIDGDTRGAGAAGAGFTDDVDGDFF